MTSQINLLSDLLRIPSVSTLTEHQPDMASARQFLVNLFKSLGFSTQLLPAPHHPAVFAQLVTNPLAPSVLVYGHYDVQPPGAPSLWHSPPFEPNIRKNRIYARGAADNKGQFLIHVLASQNLAFHPPVNFKFLVEGEEEIGSPGIETIVRDYHHLLQADYLVLSDTEMLQPGHPTIDISLRGVMDIEIVLQTARNDLHSGQFGGLAPNPAFLLTALLSQLKNRHGKILLPDFYTGVVRPTPQELADFRHLEPAPSQLLKEGRFYYLSSGSPDLTLNQRRWTEPTLDITGLDSGYTGHGTKTIIPHEASAKLSFRLVPRQDPDRIYASLSRFITRRTPRNTVVRIIRYPVASPYKAPTSHPVYRLAKQVLADTFGHPASFVGQGGSIGAVSTLTSALNIPAVMIGFGLPDENVHGPNEHFSLDNFHLGIRAMANLYSQLPSLKSSDKSNSPILPVI